LYSQRLKVSLLPTVKFLQAAALAVKKLPKKMLHENRISEVSVISVTGFLSDHYDPPKKTVNLSPSVYEGRNISAVAVAARECGHALQDAAAYLMLMLRSRLVNIVQISSSLTQWVILTGLGLFSFGGGNQTVLLPGIVLFAASTLFSVITLPVEFDASARALKWLDSANIMIPVEHDKAKDALKWVELTYVIATLASSRLLIQYILIYQGRIRDWYLKKINSFRSKFFQNLFF
jgi:Zn-dependent membrane protease YugP